MGTDVTQRKRRSLIINVLAAMCALHVGSAHADLSDPNVLALLTPLEQLAARTDQAVYNALTIAATPTGASICDPALGSQAPKLGQCTGNVFNLFSRMRELVQTADAIGNLDTQRQFSLGLDAKGLGFALRSTAPEEMAALGTSSTEFSNSLFDSLESRISALRLRAQELKFATNNTGYGDGAAYHPRRSPLGGAAGADGESLASPWGGFVNGWAEHGHKNDTSSSGGYEDAFSLDSQAIVAGVDYRLNPHVVVGGIVGLSAKTIDFDSTQGVSNGEFWTNGSSLLTYGLWESDRFYMSGSVGWQRLNNQFVRNIEYPSLNPLTPSVYEMASSSANSSALLATLGAGYDATLQGFTIEPYVKANYQHIKIDAFTETASHGFDLQYGEQRITSLDGAIGLKLQRVYTPSFGVLVPYLRGDIHREFDDKPRTISAVYSALADVGLAAAANVAFAIPTDQRDYTYGVIAAGLSMVMKEGLQAFLQYQQTIGLTTIADHTVTGGFRFEF
jgi:outer membrane autotransporter protein